VIPRVGRSSGLVLEPRCVPRIAPLPVPHWYPPLMRFCVSLAPGGIDAVITRLRGEDGTRGMPRGDSREAESRRGVEGDSESAEEKGGDSEGGVPRSIELGKGDEEMEE
jgi:hypothetical protein